MIVLMIDLTIVIIIRRRVPKKDVIGAYSPPLARLYPVAVVPIRLAAEIEAEAIDELVR
jgi:hypothetical protein